MKITETNIGGRIFINFGDCLSIPVDRIKQFNFNVANGAASGESVQIVTDDPEEEIIFAYGNCDDIKNYVYGLDK